MDHDFSFKVSFFKKALSYLMPLSLYKGGSVLNPYLELFLYRNQWQLATRDVLYSDGTRYVPFKIAFREIGKSRLSGRKHCLVLGCGLGSNVQILAEKYNCKAHFTLVEKDDRVLSWCRELLTRKGIPNITSFAEDAGSFLSNDTRHYDLICIDVFIDKVVPSFFTTPDFFRRVKEHLMPGGLWIMNYMRYDEQKYDQFRKNIEKVLHAAYCLQNKENVILWGENR